LTLISFVLAGANTLCIVAVQRIRGASTRSWRDEMLVGGEPWYEYPHPGGLRVAGAVVWLLLWAMYLHPDKSMSDRRGPWVLAMLPLLLIAGICAIGPPGATPGWSAADISALRLVGAIVVGYFVVFGFYLYLRRNQ
jgi:hypothetical protein